MATKRKKKSGYFKSSVVRSITFYLISACIFASIFASILAIWNFADPNVFLRLIGTFAVIGIGTWIFAVVNGIFGYEDNLPEE